MKCGGCYIQEEGGCIKNIFFSQQCSNEDDPSLIKCDSQIANMRLNAQITRMPSAWLALWEERFNHFHLFILNIR